MAKIEYYKRRCGNTTRQVDEWVQQLFNGDDVYVVDHAHREGNAANRHAFDMLMRRLKIEHNLSIGENSRLIWNEKERILKLLPF
jgi:tRNA isopentenyl-2-thiomethyl-A-37 hydroxylase MiaE